MDDDNLLTRWEGTGTMWSQATLLDTLWPVFPCSFWCSLSTVLLFWGYPSQTKHRLSRPAGVWFGPLSLNLVIAVPQVVKGLDYTHYCEFVWMRDRCDLSVTVQHSSRDACMCVCGHLTISDIFFWKGGHSLISKTEHHGFPVKEKKTRTVLVQSCRGHRNNCKVKWWDKFILLAGFSLNAGM